MLRFMLDRLVTLQVDDVVVATSTDPRDDAVADVANGAGVAVVRGPEQDVLGRFAGVMESHPSDHVVRLTADCPLMDPALVHAVLARHVETGADYTTNVLPRTFPKGLDIEVCRSAALARAAEEACDPREREHVTPFLYRHPERFQLANVRNDEDLSHERWTVDLPEDLAFVQHVADTIPASATGWSEILRLVGPGWSTPPQATYLRTALPGDAEFVRSLRNDPDAIRHSGHRAAVSELEHRAWFDGVLRDPARRLWVAVAGDAPVAMVRIDVESAIGTVSIAVDRAARQRGVGTSILELLLAELAGDVQVDVLHAAVAPENRASIRLFTTAGFAPAGETPRGQLLFARSVAV
jgi:spore coat polysaccharide biosynthesis protein SpsF